MRWEGDIPRLHKERAQEVCIPSLTLPLCTLYNKSVIVNITLSEFYELF